MNSAKPKLHILDDAYFSDSAAAPRSGIPIENTGRSKLNIEIVSDVICPWCWVGKRRLETAIALLGPDADVRVTWCPFQLNSTMPPGGADRRQYILAKFGSTERFAKMEDRLVEVGAAESIGFKFDHIARIPNTFDAHRLIWLAKKHDKQDAVVEALFNAYFVEGVDVGDSNVLSDIAATAGIEKNLAENFLASEEGSNAVRDEERKFKALGIQGVPSFVVNGALLFSGAAEPTVMAAAFREAAAS